MRRLLRICTVAAACGGLLSGCEEEVTTHCINYHQPKQQDSNLENRLWRLENPPRFKEKDTVRLRSPLTKNILSVVVGVNFVEGRGDDDDCCYVTNRWSYDLYLIEEATLLKNVESHNYCDIITYQIYKK